MMTIQQDLDDREINHRARIGASPQRVKVRVAFRGGQLTSDRSVPSEQRAPMLREHCPGPIGIGGNRVRNPRVTDASTRAQHRALWDRSATVSDATFEHASDGAVEVECWASDVEDLRAKVEDDNDSLRVARAQHVKSLRAWVAKSSGIEPEDLPTDWREWTGEQIRVANRHPGSVEAEFFRLAERGIRPLLSVEVLEEIDPALDRSRREAALLGEQIAKAAAPAGNQAELAAAIVQALAAGGFLVKPEPEAKGKKQ